MGWFKDAMEWVGKVIPNEISKTSGLTKYIPGIGPYMQAIGGVDAAATAYGDTGSIIPVINASKTAIMGYSQDPGKYGSPNANKDIWNTIGEISNIGIGLGNAYATGDIMGGLGTLSGIGSNPYFAKTPSIDIASSAITGNEITQDDSYVKNALFYNNLFNKQIAENSWHEPEITFAPRGGVENARL